MFQSAAIQKAVSHQIIAALEAGIIPWRRPWVGHVNSGVPMNVATKCQYKDINRLLLHLAMAQRGHQSKWWGTAQQWLSLGGQVTDRRGTEIVVQCADGNFDEVEVFNADEVGGKTTHHFRVRPDGSTVLPAYDQAEGVVLATGADIRFQPGLKAEYYPPPLDYIIFPLKIQFLNGPGKLPAFYESLFHELLHWSECRVGFVREAKTSISDHYALCELRAEIGSSFLASEVGIANLTDLRMLRNHKRFVGDWIDMMRRDPALIFQVAGAASRGVDYLLSLSLRGRRSA